MDKVSVIIPTYNRFKYLLNCLESIKKQTYENIEIIVINDCSSQKEYYEYDWEGNNIKIIHLEKNTKEVFGHSAPGFVRNYGIKSSLGKYIAFCDDDDIWFPKKIELQMNAMNENNCKMCSTDGLIGNGVYDENKTYKKYLSEHYYSTVQSIYESKCSSLLENGFPKIWNLDFLKVHNCMITSSVIIEKDILYKVNYFNNSCHGEDYDCWLKVLEHTDSIYLEDICFYYDLNHGDGQNH